MFRASWKERKTNDEVLERVGVRRELVSLVRERQMGCLGHLMRSQELETISLLGKLKDRRPRGRHRQKYMKDW